MNLVEFALGGICNCIADPIFQQQFIDSDAMSLILPLVHAIDLSDQYQRKTQQLTIRLSALSICYFLLDSTACAVLTSSTPFLHHLQTLHTHPNVRIANLALAISTRVHEIHESIEESTG